MKTRRTEVEISINSQNISKDIAPYLLSLTVNEVLEGESSTAEIELADRDRIWTADWFPERGSTCDITVVKITDGGEERFTFSGWEVDEVENSFPPNKARIKLNSVSNNTDSRSINHSQSWEQVKLSKIASDIAGTSGLELFYQTSEDPDIERAEQKDKSDLGFLKKLCADNGMIVRVGEGKLIICAEDELEQADAATVFSYGDQKLLRFSGRATISEIYSAAHVVYSHGKKKETVEATYSDATKSSGMTLEINKKVENVAEAERLAKKELRNKNKDEIKVQLEVVGDFIYSAGNVIELDETFGFYAGRYIIERANWKVGGGFKINLDVRKCLSGY